MEKQKENRSAHQCPAWIAHPDFNRDGPRACADVRHSNPGALTLKRLRFFSVFLFLKYSKCISATFGSISKVVCKLK